MTELVSCERCGAIADVVWADVATLDDPGPVLVILRSGCTTPGCVDETGSSAVLPPERPGQLTRDDQLWIRRHRRLAAEYGRADRALRDAEGGGA